MTSWTLIRRGVRHHWRTHLGVVGGAAAAAAVLAGAMVVGDSVRYSLGSLAGARLGRVHVAMASGDRYFRDELAGELAAALKAPAAAVLQLSGVASVDAARRANGVQVLGVDEGFWKLGPGGAPAAMGADEVVINQRLAAQLGVEAGGEILLRVPRPSVLPRDAPLSTDEDTSAAFRVTVRAVATDEQFGRFGLQANQLSPYTAFLSRKFMQQKVDRGGRSNLLLVGAGPTGETNAAAADAALRQAWRLSDAGMELRELPGPGVLELRTRRIFLDPPAAKAAAEAKGGAVGVLTYFVNELRAGDRAAPYSMVTAMGPLGRGTGVSPVTQTATAETAVPRDMTDDEILISPWLAADLKAEAGDEITLAYFVVGPMRTVTIQESGFRVRSVLPAGGAAADASLMPDFPGVTDAETCGDWKPGIPIDFKKIRPKDEQYWTDHRGTPKAFITLKAGQDMWGNRFGRLTAVRWPLETARRAEVAEAIRTKLAPSAVGLYFLPVRQRGLAASAESLDFGGLFLSLSFFIIAAALLLMALLFVLGVEQRGQEVGTLLALGFGRWQVRRLLLGEGLCLAAMGVAIGTPAGLLYTKALLAGLASVWGGAVAGSNIRFHVTAATLAASAGLSLLAAVGAMGLVLWRQTRAPAAALLGGAAELELKLSAGRLGRPTGGVVVGAICTVGAWAVGIVWGGRGGSAAANSFFAAGGLLLVAAVAFGQALVAVWGRSAPMTLAGLGVRNAARRPGRSLATVALLACGIFLVVSVGAFRLEVSEEARRRDSGTGGFALLGESALPVLYDLNTPAGRKDFALPDGALAGASVVPLRVRDGDDASCLNLNRAQRPVLLGVDPAQLASRGAFAFVAVAEDYPPEAGWALLNERRGREVPVVGDQATVVWALGKTVGDTIEYVDERGGRRTLRIVGMIGDSVLQGALLIANDAFEEMFPSESGYRRLLIDARADSADRVAAALTRAGENVGLQVTPAGRRLAEFNVVQNTYLSIFQVLGGLGLLLGTVGLGVVLMRNVLQRRGELALMRAVGFSRDDLYDLVLCEHLVLLGLGAAGGVGSGLLAVAPALQRLPLTSLGLTVYAIVLGGMVWMLLATAAALRGPLMAALRNE